MTSRTLALYIAAGAIFAATLPGTLAQGIVTGKPAVGSAVPTSGVCAGPKLPGGCTCTVNGWDITGNVNLDSLEQPDYCSCLEQCAGNTGSTVLAKQCQTWVYNPANSVTAGGNGSCTLYADISPGFSGSGATLTAAAAHVPKIPGGVSGILLPASDGTPTGVAGYIC